MKKGVKRLVILVVISFCLSTAVINAQFLKDTASINLIKRGIDYVYNCQFSKADDVFNAVSNLYPGHPVMYLLKGMIIYWKNYPLVSSSQARAEFEKDLRTCMELSENNKDHSFEADNLLTNLCARGFLLLFYTDNDLSSEVFPLATSTYQYIKRSFNFTSEYSDFYFFTGLYIYYREVYPEFYPIYKPLAMFFPKGDRVLGLQELQIVANSSIVLKAEAFSFLSVLYLSFENNFKQATNYSKSLHELYPDNLDYTAAYFKNLLLIKNYNEAEKLMSATGTNQNNTFFQAQVQIFNGILQEKKYNDNRKAMQYYTEGLRNISGFGAYGNEYAAYAYFGLSRISDANGDQENKKIYEKQALKLAAFKNIDFN